MDTIASSIITAALISLSLCADILAVTVCGSLKLGKISAWETTKIASIFALVHFTAITLGWAAGHSIVTFVEKYAPYIAFAILLYIGGSMIISAIKEIREGSEENESAINLVGTKNLFLAGVATSIDAVAVGVSMAMENYSLAKIMFQGVILAIVTLAVAIAGITFGRQIGLKFGHAASIVGGLVLIGIGVWALI